MTWIAALAYLGYAVLAGTAIAVARRERVHRPVAAWVVWMIASDWARLGLTTLRAGQPRPYRGVMVAYLVTDRILALTWTFSFVAVVLHYFTKLGWSKIALLLAPTFLAAAIACSQYPAMRGENVAMIFRAVFLFGIAATWVAIAYGTLFADLKPALAHLVLMFFATSDVIALALPYAGDFVTNWPVVQMVTIITIVAALIAHAWALWRRPGETASEGEP